MYQLCGWAGLGFQSKVGAALGPPRSRRLAGAEQALASGALVPCCYWPQRAAMRTAVPFPSVSWCAGLARQRVWSCLPHPWWYQLSLSCPTGKLLKCHSFSPLSPAMVFHSPFYQLLNGVMWLSLSPHPGYGPGKGFPLSLKVNTVEWSPYTLGGWGMGSTSSNK